MADAAAAAGVAADEAEALLASAREKLHARRSQRPRPHLDDKARPALVCVRGWLLVLTTLGFLKV